MIVKYINSQNQVIDFSQYNTRIYSGSFHKYEWKYETTKLDLGVSIDRFTKEELDLEMSVAIREGFPARYNTLNNILKITDYDVINKSAGTLYVGDWYIKCYLISSETTPNKDIGGAERKFKIIAPYPMWIKEEFKEFKTAEREESEYDFLDYPYDYDYDYMPSIAGQRTWFIDNNADNEFEMTIFGYCVNPRILINGYPYQIYDTIESNEYVVVNSRNNTVIKYLANGTTENIFDKRAKDNSVFQKIPSGQLQMTWNGTFGFNIKLFLGRSEPSW